MWLNRPQREEGAGPQVGRGGNANMSCYSGIILT